MQAVPLIDTAIRGLYRSRPWLESDLNCCVIVQGSRDATFPTKSSRARRRPAQGLVAHMQMLLVASHRLGGGAPADVQRGPLTKPTWGKSVAARLTNRTPKYFLTLLCPHHLRTSLSLSQSACHSFGQRVPFDWPPADCRMLLFRSQTSGVFGLVMRIIMLERMQRSVDMAVHQPVTRFIFKSSGTAWLDSTWVLNR